MPSSARKKNRLAKVKRRRVVLHRIGPVSSLFRRLLLQLSASPDIQTHVLLFSFRRKMTTVQLFSERLVRRIQRRLVAHSFSTPYPPSHQETGQLRSIFFLE